MEVTISYQDASSIQSEKWLGLEKRSVRDRGKSSDKGCVLPRDSGGADGELHPMSSKV